MLRDDGPIGARTAVPVSASIGIETPVRHARTGVSSFVRRIDPFAENRPTETRVGPRSLFFASAFAAAFAIARPASAACDPPKKADSVDTLPVAWRSALDDLVRSAAEPGHPWSCSGGDVALDVGANGASLTVNRAGEPPITRTVALPSDVVPLGQALLAAPLSLPEEAPSPPPSVTMPPAIRAEPTIERDAPSPVEPAKKEPRLLLGGGFDGRGVTVALLDVARRWQ